MIPVSLGQGQLQRGLPGGVSSPTHPGPGAVVRSESMTSDVKAGVVEHILFWWPMKLLCKLHRDWETGLTSMVPSLVEKVLGNVHKSVSAGPEENSCKGLCWKTVLQTLAANSTP